MQPDPAVFLPAIRRAISRPDLLGPALQSGLTPILTYRAAEGLAQLALRHEVLPSMLRRFNSRQRSILRRGVTLLQAAGQTLPAASAAALAFRTPRGPPGEQDILGYEILIDGISSVISALSLRSNAAGVVDPNLEKLCSLASRLEFDMRTSYKSALAEGKAQIDSRADGTLAVAVPLTDANVTEYLRGRFSNLADIMARNVRRLAGVNAQEIYFFELDGHPEWGGPMVLRRVSGFNPTGASLEDEFELLRYVYAGGLPVPAVLLVERDPARLGGVFLMMKRLPGATRTAEPLEELGRPLALSMAAILAKLHQLDWRGLSDVRGGPDVRSIRQHMQNRIERFYRRWQSERIETSLVLESAFSWLRANVACVNGAVSLVHGDCNFRNILLDGGRVSALLDWELSHFGSGAEDLSYIRPDIEKLIPWNEFLEGYVEAGGTAPSDAEMAYFEVWANAWRTSMAACVYAGYIRGEHDNFIFATVAFNEYYTTLDDLAGFMVRKASRP